jgi:hypothetical protein
MSQVAEIEGLKELVERMTEYPTELIKTMAVGMSASLNIFWENVPPYPSRPESSYRRTGTLGRSLGSDQSGGATSEPSVYRIRQLGGGNFEGTFGTNLDYAPYVIGDTTQAQVHSGVWWQMADVATKATPKITELWNNVAEKLARFLEGK